MTGYDYIGVSVIAAMGWLVGHVAGQTIDTEPIGMRLVELYWHEGEVHQRHLVYGVDVLPATWTAQFQRGPLPLCEGSGDAPYSGNTIASMPSDRWASPDCPEIVSGDIGVATWRWVDQHGTRHTISGSFKVTD